MANLHNNVGVRLFDLIQMFSAVTDVARVEVVRTTLDTKNNIGRKASESDVDSS